jgi:SET domain-containing protein
MERRDLEVKESRMEGAGKGLFALVPFAKDEFIVEYTGVRIPTKEAEEHTGRYLFEVEGTPWTIDGEPGHSFAKYINHACDPNAEARIEDERIMMYAVRDIKAGDEISIDYGQEYFDDYIKPVGCRCGATVHRT